MARISLILAALALGTPLANTPAAIAQNTPETKQTPWRLGAVLDLPEGLRIDGSVRARYEALANPFVSGRSDDDEYLGWQTLVRAELDFAGANLTLGGELLDSRFLAGNETGGVASEIDTLEPSQLYLAWWPGNFMMDGGKLDLTLGRFTMDVGSRRLVARAAFRSILASFDGVRAVWTSPDQITVTLAYTAPVARAPADAPSALVNEVSLNHTLDKVRFGVAHVDAPLPFDLRGELYLLDLDEGDSSKTPTRNRDLSTVGVRLRKLAARDQFDFDVEFAHQSGSVHATTSPTDVTRLDHDASMTHMEAGFSFDAPWSPRLALQYDLATGDDSPVDAKSGRFDPLFGDRAFEFGPTGIYGLILRANVSSPGVRLEVKPDSLSDAYVMLRDVRLDAGRDSFANSAVRDATGASGTKAGLQIEGRYRRWLVKDSLRLSVGAATFTEGDFLTAAPNATRQGDPLFGYADLTWTF
jgi:Alginate export